MDTLDCWLPDKQLGAWLSTSPQFEPVVHVQGNRAALESLAKVLKKLASTAVGERAVLDTMTGLNTGDIVLSLEHTEHPSAPPAVDLVETRVAPPEEGDAVLWGRVSEEQREDVVRLLVAEGGHTSLQARDAVARGGTFATRLNGDVAVHLRESLRRLGIDCALFELRS